MRKPLEMRGWAIRHTWMPPDGVERSELCVAVYASRGQAREWAYWQNKRAEVMPVPQRYTVVPVVVRERR